jgi:hypothetical protein
MKRTAITGLILVLVFVTGLVAFGGEDKKTNELLEAALTKETIEGDLKGAITLYEQAVKEAGSNRVLAAKAQLRLASAYQKQGNEQSRAIYERVARDYADIPAAAAEAQSRLNSLKSATNPLAGDAAFGKLIGLVKVIAPEPAPAPPTPTRAQRQITLFDRQGKMLGTVGDPGPPGTMTISPDGKRVALVRNGSILVFDVRTQGFITLTSGPSDNQPTWSADGKRIAFEVRAGTDKRVTGVYIKPSDGSGPEELIARLGGITLVGWSPDARHLTYQRNGLGTAADLWVLPLAGDQPFLPLPALVTPASENGLRISPDGRYMSYRVIEADRTDVYVSPFDLNASGIPEKWKITSSGPGAAVAGVRWRADGKELYFIDANGGVTAVEATTTPSFKVGQSKVLFQVPAAYQSAPGQTAGFSDVTADGQIFALMVPR